MFRFMRSPIATALMALVALWAVVAEGRKAATHIETWLAQPCPRADVWYRGLSRNKEYAVRGISRWGGGESEIFIIDGNRSRCVRFPTSAVPRSPTRVTLTDEPAFIWRRMDD